MILTDFDECSVDGTCSQLCQNTNGSYHCSCVEGYQLRPDGRGCKALGKLRGVSSDQMAGTC